MAIFNFNDLNKQSKIGYNALYNVVMAHVGELSQKNREVSFIVPLCLNSDNKVSLTEKNFIFFESIISELSIDGYYTIIKNNGRAVEEIKTDFYTVKIVIGNYELSRPEGLKVFDFSDVDTSKLLKRDGKAEKAKTEENKEKEKQEKKTVEETSKALEEKTAEIETLKKEVAKKDEQLNKKAIAEFNDDALFSIADCIEVLIKKHCPIPAEFDFSTFESDLFQVINSHWDLKVLDK